MLDQRDNRVYIVSYQISDYEREEEKEFDTLIDAKLFGQGVEEDGGSCFSISGDDGIEHDPWDVDYK